MAKRFVTIYKEGSPLGSGQKQIIVDIDTGVHYIFMQSGYAGGLTPLLDARGNPISGTVSASDSVENAE